MRQSILFSLLAASAAGAPLEARDGPGGFDLSKLGIDTSQLAGLIPGGGDFLKNLPGGADAIKGYSALWSGKADKIKALSIEEVKPRLRADSKRVKVTYGPFKIKGTETKEKVGNGFSLDPAGTGYMYRLDDDFPRDITLLEAISNVVDDKKEAPIDIGKGLYNHHNVYFSDSGSYEMIAACGEAPKPFPFKVPGGAVMSSSTESNTVLYTSTDGKFNSGAYLKKNAVISQMMDIVNYNKEDKNVYVVSEIEYMPGKVEDALPSSGAGIDIAMCNKGSKGYGEGMNIHAPAGVKQWSINGSDVTLTQNGYFLASTAHLHDGAVNMVVWLNGKEMCDIKAVYGGPGREGKNPDGTPWVGLAGTQGCDKVIKVKKGDKMRFQVNFDTALHPERQFENTKEGHGSAGMAEIMALFTTTFARDVPGGAPKYLAIQES